MTAESLTAAARAILVGAGTRLNSDEIARRAGITEPELRLAQHALRQRFGVRTNFYAFEAARTAGLLDGFPRGGRWWWLRVEIGAKVKPHRLVGGFFAYGAFADQFAARAALRCLASFETARCPVLSMSLRLGANNSRWQDISADPSCDQVPEPVKAALVASMRRWTADEPPATGGLLATADDVNDLERQILAALGSPALTTIS